MARRSVERGVRFVEVYIERQIWDNHSDLESSLHYCSGKTDNPAATLIKDRKRLGLLESMLFISTGEFGRMPISPDTGHRIGRPRPCPSGFKYATTRLTSG
jgi:hypothetical protein